MKNILFTGIVILLFATCNSNQEKQRYTQQSPEIDTYKNVIDAYEKRDWEAMAGNYADTAKILNNVTMKDAQTIEQLVATNKEDAKLFSSWKYDPESEEYEMVVTDNGETWVNFWGHWEGTLLANNKTYIIPAHITSRFVDGKIVREDGYWDISKLMGDINAMQTDSTMTEKPVMD